LDHVDLERRVEGTVGHILHENVWVEFVGPLDVDWSGGPLDGDSFVKVSKRDDQAVQVQFNIDVDVPGPSRLSGSLSFDLRFEGICRNPDASPPLPARLSMKMERAAASADFGGITEALTLWLINFAEGSIADRMVDAFPDFSEDIDIDNEIVDCVTPVVRDNGDVDFEVSLASTPAGGIRGDTSGVLTDSGTSTPPKTVGTIGTVTTGTLAP
jgi:hypothetical protein